MLLGTSLCPPALAGKALHSPGQFGLRKLCPLPSRSELEEIQPPLVSSSVQKCQALGNSRAQKRLSPELGRNEAKMLARERDEQSQREPVWHGTGF